jgi:hypothetical protein
MATFGVEACHLVGLLRIPESIKTPNRVWILSKIVLNPIFV